jgi:hypothetical protein
MALSVSRAGWRVSPTAGLADVRPPAPAGARTPREWSRVPVLSLAHDERVDGEAAVIQTQPPKMVFNEHGQLVEVIMVVDDFREYMRVMVGDTPWEDLPEPWQDAIDQLLIEDVASERPAAVDLDDVLAADPS